MAQELSGMGNEELLANWKTHLFARFQPSIPDWQTKMEAIEQEILRRLRAGQKTATPSESASYLNAMANAFG
jgi:hypothetical protein